MGFKDRIAKVISSPEIDENDIEMLINSGLKEITLKKDIDLTKTVNINTDNITIDGKNHAITSNRKQIFNITGDNITLKNITFKNAHPDQAGGAIYNRNGKLRIIECNFINNHSARDNGGAIYNDNGTVIIDGCDFKSNTARFGGAIYNKKTMTVMFSNFSNNNSSKGPSIFNALDFTLETCNFKRNSKAQDIEVLNILVPALNNLHKNFYVKIPGGFRQSNPLYADAQLTDREVEIVDLICQGVSPANISKILHIATSTTYKHIAHIYEKFHVSSRQALLVKLLNQST